MSEKKCVKKAGGIDVYCSHDKLVDYTQLIPNPKNPNIHPEKQVKLLAKIIRHQGWRQAITVSNRSGYIVKGHGRLEASKLLAENSEERDFRVPVDFQDYKDEASEYADMIADNRIAELAEIDLELMDGLLLDPIFEDFDIELTGFDELPKVETEFETDAEDDEVPEEAEPRVKLGEVWKLGEHRLMCGDATNKEHYKKLMMGHLADMCITDPPYNVDYTGKTKDELKVKNDKMEDSDFRRFLHCSFEAMFENIKSGGAFYIWHADSEGFNFRGAVNDCGQIVRQCLIWNKNHMVMGRQDYHWKHEPCLYGWKEGASHLWNTDRKQVTVLNFDRPSANREHPTMKPVDMFSYLIKNNSKPEELVLDMFAGSGSTIIASQKTNRKCYSMELDPVYCDVILTRWEKYTGEKAERDG